MSEDDAAFGRGMLVVIGLLLALWALGNLRCEFHWNSTQSASAGRP